MLILDVITTIHSGSEFDNNESTVSHLFLKTPLPPAGSSEDRYAWKITEGTRGAMDHSRSTYSQVGSGSCTLVTPEITIIYALQCDDLVCFRSTGAEYSSSHLSRETALRRIANQSTHNCYCGMFH